MQKITPFLWYENNAEEAVKFYTSIFPNSKTGATAKYDEAGSKASGLSEGTVMTIPFQLNGQDFVALNGGSHFKFNEAISFVINCETQEEIDCFWEKLSEGGDPRAQMCGWLKDKFGISWQVVPTILDEFMKDPQKAPKATNAFLKMKKFVIKELIKAANE